MSWTGTNPVSVGDPTKKKNYDVLWDNVEHIRTNVMSSGVVMIFGQNDAPTGWTLKTDWTNNSMLVYTTDAAISGGGSDNPYDPHGHKWLVYQGNTAHEHTFNAAGGEVDVPRDGIVGSYRAITMSTETDGVLGSTCYTDKAWSPLYQKVIAATKDGY